MWDWAPKRISGLPRCASQRGEDLSGCCQESSVRPSSRRTPARFHPRSCALTLRLTVIAQQKQPPPGSSVSRRRRMCAHWITRRVLPALRCALLLRAQLSRTRPAARQQTAKDEYRGAGVRGIEQSRVLWRACQPRHGSWPGRTATSLGRPPGRDRRRVLRARNQGFFCARILAMMREPSPRCA